MPPTATAAPIATPASSFTLVELALLDVVESSWNPRQSFDEVKLQELAASIREKGVLAPILVREVAFAQALHGERRYEIVAGARRFRASLLAGRQTIPAIVRELDDVEALEIAVVENGQREDVHPLEEARGYEALLRAGAGQAYDVARIAHKVGKTESAVYRRLKLLNLEADLQTAFAEGRLSLGHAEKLMRLTPALRKEATDLDTGVVWRRSPLLEYGDKWIPSADDLRPLTELEQFIRTRSHFSPANPDARHFQPDLAPALDALLRDAGHDERFDSEELAIAELAALVSLSLDPMVRMRLRAPKGESIPLAPSQWHEVTTDKQRCDYTVKGCITHGGEPRVLDVCVKKSCKKHFPPKAAERSTGNGTAASRRQETAKERERQQREAQEREQREKAWQALKPLAGRALAKHMGVVKFSARVVAAVVDSYHLERVREVFGLALTDKTAAQVLLLSRMPVYTFEAFAQQAKDYKFDLAAFEKQQQKAAAAAPAGKAQATEKAKAAKKPAAKKSAGQKKAKRR